MIDTHESFLRRPAIDLIGDAQCTGCSACINACSQLALELGQNSAGFYRPVVDRDKCTNCGVCALKCPVILEEQGKLERAPWIEPKAFAARSRDENIHLSSSSGGAFTEIARVILSRSGVVAGCAWGDDWMPTHILVRTDEELKELRGSKYVQSKVGVILNDIVGLCKHGIPVLFSGTPCQVAAIKHLLKPSEREHLVTCEVVCHGVPSPKVFDLYLRWLFAGGKVKNYTFRAKTKGWQTVYAQGINGKVYELPLSADPYARLGFVYHLSLMQSCFGCVFQRLPRVADITLGDFWGIPAELDDPRGVSLVLANSPKGEALCLETAQMNTLEMVSVDLSVAGAKNPRVMGKQWTLPRFRAAFLRDVAQGHSFTYLLRKYYFALRTIERIYTRIAYILRR